MKTVFDISNVGCGGVKENSHELTKSGTWVMGCCCFKTRENGEAKAHELELRNGGLSIAHLTYLFGAPKDK